VGDVDGDGDLDLLSVGHPSAPGVDTQSRFHASEAATGVLRWSVSLPGRAHAPVGGAYSDTPTLSVSGDVDNDGRVESIFAIGSTLYVVGANPSGASGQIEWTFSPDNGLLGSPILADGNGDGQLEIIVVSTSGRIYGIGKPAAPTFAAGVEEASVATDVASLGSEILSEQPIIVPMWLASESIDRTQLPAIPRQITSNEELRKINERLLPSVLDTELAREVAFAEFAVDGRIIDHIDREFISASAWQILSDGAFKLISRFTT
jgi:hypothetical protein